MDQLYMMAGKRSMMGDYHAGSMSKSALVDSDRGFTSSAWASLLDVVDRLHINVAGFQSRDLDTIKTLILQQMKGAFTQEQERKLYFAFNQTVPRNSLREGDFSTAQKDRMMLQGNLSEGEASTINEVWKYCKKETDADRRSLVYYIHNKGGCCYPYAQFKGGQRPDNVNLAVSAWRDVMNAFTIEFPSICMRAILGGYSTCGYGTQGVKAHFTGNFWWADCGHVAALPPIITFFDAWKAELFIGRTSKFPSNRLHIMHRCAYEGHHCGGDHYQKVCHRNEYYSRIRNLVNSSDPMPRLGSNESDVSYRKVRKTIDIRKGYDDAALSARANYYAPGAPQITSECRPLYLKREGGEGVVAYKDQDFWGKQHYFEE
jgi:hypothetical protein